MAWIWIPRFTKVSSFGIVKTEIDTEDVAPCSSCETRQMAGYLSDPAQGPVAL